MSTPPLPPPPVTSLPLQTAGPQPTGGTPRPLDDPLVREVAHNAPLHQFAVLAARLLTCPSGRLLLVADRHLPGPSGIPAPVSPSVSADGWADAVGQQCAQVLTTGGTVVVHGVVGPPAEQDAFLGVPLVDAYGQPWGVLCVGDAGDRRWTAAEVVLLEQLASSADAEPALSVLAAEHESNHLLLQMAVDAGQIGTFEWNLRTGKFACSEQLIALYGYEAGFQPSLEGFFLARLHPEDVARVTAAVEQAIATLGTYEVSYRIVLPSGELRWLAARGEVLVDGTGSPLRLLGATYDTSAVHDSEANVTRVLEAMPAGFCMLDADWRFTYVNTEAEQILGRTRGQLLGRSHWEAFPSSANSVFELNYRKAIDTGQQVIFEGYSPTVGCWFELRARPLPDGLSVYFLDITARRAAQELADRSLARWALLAEITAELSSTLDGEESVALLARLVVPSLAEWCIVTVLDADDHGGSRRVARDVGWWHEDPQLRPLVDRYCATRVGALTGESLVDRVLRTGRSVVVARDGAARMRSVLAPGEARDLAADLAAGSLALFPLRGRSQTIGVLTLLSSEARGPLSAADLVTAAEVADRAGMALENAQLFNQQRELAEALQRALLTAPPVSTGLDVVVRYAPSAQAAQVGGDWYDVFRQPDGATMLVIGDVVGHDTAAAAAMGQLRALLRGIAACHGDGPSAVLVSVDQVIDTLQIDTTATVIVARLVQTAQDAARGVRQLRWSNAGHPPPMLLTPDGRVEVLASPEPDLLLGFDPAATRAEWSTELTSGATVLLYTDGLVERRGQSLDDGLARLRSTLAELAHLDLADLCDEVLERLLPARSEDDVALVAVRLH